VRPWHASASPLSEWLHNQARQEARASGIGEANLAEAHHTTIPELSTRYARPATAPCIFAAAALLQPSSLPVAAAELPESLAAPISCPPALHSTPHDSCYQSASRSGPVVVIPLCCRAFSLSSLSAVC